MFVWLPTYKCGQTRSAAAEWRLDGRTRPPQRCELAWRKSTGGSLASACRFNSVPFSLQANSTDWSTAIDRRILVPISVDTGVSRGQRSGTLTAINLNFLDRSRYFFFQVALHLSSWVWVDSVPNPLLLRKSGSAGNRTRNLWVCS
jgi:hypothetical protein